jgi:hypothetical protein
LAGIAVLVGAIAAARQSRIYCRCCLGCWPLIMSWSRYSISVSPRIIRYWH